MIVVTDSTAFVHPLAERGGIYVPLDVNYADDPKVIEAGPEAELLYVRSLAIAKRIGSDGVIHRAHLFRLVADFPTIELGESQDTDFAATLVRVGLWVEHPKGWKITAWERWNLTEAELRERRTGKAASGVLGNHNRWHAARGVTDPECPHCVPDPPEDAASDNRSDSDSVPDRYPIGYRSDSDSVPDRYPNRQDRDRDRDRDKAKPETGTLVEQELDGTIPVADVFDFWRDKCKHPRAMLDAKRRRRIEWAVRHYPPEDIHDAILGAATSEFHQGRNERGTRYDDICLIFRDAEHLERFRDEWRNGPVRTMPREWGALGRMVADGRIQ